MTNTRVSHIHWFIVGICDYVSAVMVKSELVTLRIIPGKPLNEFSFHDFFCNNRERGSLAEISFISSARILPKFPPRILIECIPSHVLL